MYKTYADYMDEISADELFEGLLGYGLFADKMPPCLSSEAYYSYCKTHNPTYDQKKWHQFAIYSNIHNTNVPRILGIPTPMSYYAMCSLLKNNWADIQQYFRNKTQSSSVKVSRIHIRKIKGKKHLFEMNYPVWKTDGSPNPDFLIGSRYVVHADISQCFPSIYTHALPWALVGKDNARQQMGPGHNSKWFNRIDSCTSRMKDGQTHGLLIGPHASNLLAEMILCAIDAELSPHWKYVRNIDDYTCYVKTYDEAQNFLYELEKHLRTYELTLNTKKTQIAELPQATIEQWDRQLNSVSLLASYGKVNYKSAQGYLDFAVELMQKNGMNSSILKYAIKVLKDMPLTENAKRCCEKTIFHLTVIYPYLVPLLEEYVFQAFSVSDSAIKNILEILYDVGRQTHNYETTAYVLYYALLHNCQITSININDIITSQDCIYMLMAYLYCKHWNMQSDINTLHTYALGLSSKDPNTFDPLWVFAYEALDATELKGDWVALKKAKISFVKQTW